ncbi:MAG: leucyl-tRNA synthetase [Candidatus Pseudothioglobus sp.]|jgi:leucyl-tRNA synthetase
MYPCACSGRIGGLRAWNATQTTVMQGDKMTETTGYNPQKAEREVQQRWADEGTYTARELPGEEKFYCLSMFPYPSGQLHMGHVRNYTLGDVIGRFARLQGKNVMQPMGWDAFGLPAENAAIKHNESPMKWTRENIEYMKQQLQALGFAYDWSRELATCDPEYYRWEQWFFNQMFQRGLVYKKAAMVNWDPVDQTVLANEQVVDGRGWRSGALVERRELAQWFLKITDYAQELLDDLDTLDGWPDKIKTMQRNWIGRSEGVQVSFPLPADSAGGTALTVYTTRPDTLMGVTYLAVAAQHPLAQAAAIDNPTLQAFLLDCQQGKMAEADMAKLEKRGMATGLYAAHPLSGEQVPIWVANFVLMEYGSGAVMAVPGHDQRDWEFAIKYALPIVQVIAPAAGSDEVCDIEAQAYVSKQGVCINSGEFDELAFRPAFEAVANALIARQLGERQVNFRLRDWGVSRQRYWGCPIPIINCEACGPVPVPDSELPVELPADVVLEGVGSPLKKMPEWYETTCPTCGAAAQRETDTFDTFMESSWYHARFASSQSTEGMVDERAKYWGQVDHYVGGEEHAILHLLYARFFYKVMRDAGLVDGNEPFKKLLSLGMVLKDGAKMSKSAGDAGDPQHLMNQHGADAVRMAMMFAAPPEQSFEWSERGVESAARWLRTRLWHTVEEHVAGGGVSALDKSALTDAQKDLRRVVHETINKAGDDYGRRLTFNTVIAAVMALMNDVNRFDDGSKQGRAVVHEALRAAVLIMSPITPHISELLWQKLAHESIDQARWLVVDEAALTKTSIELVIQVNGKLRSKFQTDVDAPKDQVEAFALRDDNVARFIDGKTIRKVIYVPNKLINFVVG